MKTTPLSDAWLVFAQCGQTLSVGEDGPIITQNVCK